MKKMLQQKMAYILVVVCVLTMLNVPGHAAGSSYQDIPSTAWYKDAVDYVTRNGIMTGTGKEKFSPKEGMTRAMLVQVLYAYAGKPDAPRNEFTDVTSGSWFEESSAWAAEKGIVSGYTGGKFGGNDPVTRQQFITILWRYAGSPEAKTGKYFADRSNITEYAREAVNWARAANIISGGDGNVFEPQSVVIRSHCAAILKNYILMGPNTLDPKNSTVFSASIDSSAQQTFYLWDTANMPKTTVYDRNTGNYVDDLSFCPNVITYPVPSGTIVKGAVLVLAGGSFQQRSNSSEGYPVADELSKMGYVSFVVNYRLYPYSVKDAEMDLARAIRFVRYAADEYGYRKDNIAVLGFSAGAMATGGMLLDFDSTDDPSVLDKIYIPDTLDEVDSSICATGMLYGFYGNLQSSIKDVQMFKEAVLPKAFFCFGSQDAYAPECRGCAEALEEAGVGVQLMELSDMGHGFGLDGDWLEVFDPWLTKLFIQNALMGGNSTETTEETNEKQNTENRNRAE